MLHVDPIHCTDQPGRPAGVQRPDDEALYTALLSHDPRFDGRFFIGVTSTGIYCRPVCRVRTPRRENCRFFASAASAEHAGFRPCLRCRPELAPGLARIDGPRTLAHEAARMLTHAVRSGEPVRLPELAARVGVSARHLRRIFADVHGVSPIEYLMTQRLMMAKHLLTDTALPVAQVALDAGFQSVRRFNAVFAQSYRMSPGALRREGTAAARRRPAAGGEALELRLSLRPPYDVSGLLRFFGERALAGIESVGDDGLRRTLALGPRGERVAGWLALRLRPSDNSVGVTLAPSLVPRLGAVLERVRDALDLDADPLLIGAALDDVPVAGRAGTRVAGSFDGFETAVRIVLGQQVTVAAARTLAQRLVDYLGAPAQTPWPDLNRLFPDARALLDADPERLGRLGIVRQRVHALQVLAGEVHAGRIALHRGAPLAATLDALRALPGIGEWTVQMIALRVLAWPDAFPSTDLGVRKALGTREPLHAQALAEAWRPWRAYAVMRLWQSPPRAPTPLQQPEGSP